MRRHRFNRRRLCHNRHAIFCHLKNLAKSRTYMVEAGGIEPPSENRRAVATTRLFRDLISPPHRPRTGCKATSHFVFRECAQVADGVSLAH